MELTYRPFSLEFKHPFTISSATRTHTKVVYVEITHNGFTGYGEASLPPYLPETQESVIGFLEKINPQELKEQANLAAQLHYVETLEENNFAAKAAMDIALHDLYGKQTGKPLHKIWNLETEKLPPALYTIGISNNEGELEEKIIASEDFTILKLKAGKEIPLKQIKMVRMISDKALCVDVNQGWKNKEEALEWIKKMADAGVVFIEQPLPKEDLSALAWLSERSPILIIADESFQVIEDIDKLKNACHGINVKLMKCGGLEKARLIIAKAKQHEMLLVMGCMSESSCAVAAATQLAPLTDYADLDGPLLIKNDPFSGVVYQNGKIILQDVPGTGAKKINLER